MKTRSWFYVVLGLTGGFTGGAIAAEFVPRIAMAVRHPRKVAAEQFVIVDRDGKERAKLQLTAGGIATLAMYDDQRHVRVEVHVPKDGGASIGFF